MIVLRTETVISAEPHQSQHYELSALAYVVWPPPNAIDTLCGRVDTALTLGACFIEMYEHHESTDFLYMLSTTYIAEWFLNRISASVMGYMVRRY